MPTKFFTQKEINRENDKPKTCLVILFGVVYNLHHFAQFDHPGGANILMRSAGEILDDIVQDAIHNFTANDIQKKFTQYQVGFFGEKYSAETDAVNSAEHKENLARM